MDGLLESLVLAADPVLDAIVERNRAAGLPDIAVSPLQGAFLGLLVRIAGARRVLEIGTLGGFSTVHLARALPDGGRVVTLESEAHYAQVARENLRTAGVADSVELIEGRAADTLPGIEGPFELVFVDADKASMPLYLEHALRLTRSGALIVGDNVVRGGAIADPPDASSAGARRFLELLGAEPRVEATALQVVGAKGWDGLALARVL